MAELAFSEAWRGEASEVRAGAFKLSGKRGADSVPGSVPVPVRRIRLAVRFCGGDGNTGSGGCGGQQSGSAEYQNVPPESPMDDGA